MQHTHCLLMILLLPLLLFSLCLVVHIWRLSYTDRCFVHNICWKKNLLPRCILLLIKLSLALTLYLRFVKMISQTLHTHTHHIYYCLSFLYTTNSSIDCVLRWLFIVTRIMEFCNNNKIMWFRNTVSRHNEQSKCAYSIRMKRCLAMRYYGPWCCAEIFVIKKRRSRRNGRRMRRRKRGQSRAEFNQFSARINSFFVSTLNSVITIIIVLN